jgi:hypothetical protein
MKPAPREGVLKPHVRVTIATLLQAGAGQHEISRETGGGSKDHPPLCAGGKFPQGGRRF